MRFNPKAGSLETTTQATLVTVIHHIKHSKPTGGLPYHSNIRDSDHSEKMVTMKKCISLAQNCGLYNIVLMRK